MDLKLVSSDCDVFDITALFVTGSILDELEELRQSLEKPHGISLLDRTDDGDLVIVSEYIVAIDTVEVRWRSLRSQQL